MITIQPSLQPVAHKRTVFQSSFTHYEVLDSMICTVNLVEANKATQRLRSKSVSILPGHSKRALSEKLFIVSMCGCVPGGPGGPMERQTPASQGFLDCVYLIKKTYPDIFGDQHRDEA